MMQPPEEIEASYNNPDPWGFRSHPDDKLRKEKIIGILKEKFPRFNRALDIGCGEGFITEDLPADEIQGYEISNQAKSRLPKNVTPTEEPFGKYDLVIATGVLYQHYDCRAFFKLIKGHASNVILTCNIAAWEHSEMTHRIQEMKFLMGREIYSETFHYREFLQQLRVFKL